MITRMDSDVGRLLARLEHHGIADNTVIFFTSDNGPHREGGNDPDFQDSNGPLRGIKRDLTEGGIRVPMIVRWPGKTGAGVTSDFVGGFQDIMPTLADLADTQAQVPDDIDGISFAPTLSGDAASQPEHDFLYWAFYERRGARAVRRGHWKAVQQPIRAAVRLYDLKNDLGEQVDVAAAYPQRVAELVRLMDGADTPTRRWKFPGAVRKKATAN